MKRKLRKILLFLGDWGILYLSLFVLTALRYGNDWQIQWDQHFRPFSFIFPIWLIALYSSYLYETRFLRPSIDALRAVGASVFIALVGSIAAFYIFPPGLIYPRRNMVLFALIFTLLLLLWRFIAYKVVRSQVKTNVLFLGKSKEVDELKKFFEDNPSLGYNCHDIVEDIPNKTDVIASMVKDDNIGLVVVKPPERSHKIKGLFSLLSSGVTVIELGEFYERLLNKVSPELVDDTWFIKNLENVNLGVYEFGKRVLDILISIIGLIVFLILFVPMALLIKLDSKGSVIFKQKRVGKNNKIFEMYKFRTMKSLAKDGSAETKGVEWTKENDSRITKAGRLLRLTRIDELPQFWNILKGDLSFVGPRPERPEFVEELNKDIPHYDMRHLVKPGLTGWAQINYEYGDSVEDAFIKLQYDIYYAKKRSLMLDLAILLKTAKIVLTRQGR